jgi:hypothetical protein
MKFHEVPVSYDHLFHLVSSLSFLFFTLSSPKNTMSCHPCPSLNDTINSYYRVKHIPSTASSEYRIHWFQHTLSTAYTAYFIIPTSIVSCSQPVSHLLPDHVVLNSLYSLNYMLINALSLSSQASPSWTTASRLTTSNNCCNVSRSWSPSASPNTLDRGLYVYLHTSIFRNIWFIRS